MPITSSAKKALRQNVRRRAFNLTRQVAMKEAIAKIERAPATTKTADQVKLLADAYQAIDKAAKRGVIKPNTAARKKSQMAKLFSVTKSN